MLVVHPQVHPRRNCKILSCIDGAPTPEIWKGVCPQLHNGPAAMKELSRLRESEDFEVRQGMVVSEVGSLDGFQLARISLFGIDKCDRLIRISFIDYM